MASSRLSTPLRPAFAPEWLAVAALALVDVVWARVIGLHLSLGPVALAMPFILLGLVLLPRLIGRERIALFFEYGALSLLGSFGLITLSYLCMASSGALADGWLLAADRALGFQTVDKLLDGLLGKPHPVAEAGLRQPVGRQLGQYLATRLKSMAAGQKLAGKGGAPVFVGGRKGVAETGFMAAVKHLDADAARKGGRASSGTSPGSVH